MAQEVALIAAMDEKRTIGRENRLLWRLPDDMKRFRKQTMGHPVVMGRKTYESIGAPLPGRRNIVLTRNPDFYAEGVETAASVSEALRMAADAQRLCVIGGGEIYAAFLPHADAMFLTRIDHVWDGDAQFPEWNESEWRLVREEPGEVNLRNPYLHRFCEYRRNR